MQEISILKSDLIEGFKLKEEFNADDVLETAKRSQNQLISDPAAENQCVSAKSRGLFLFYQSVYWSSCLPEWCFDSYHARKQEL